VIVVEHLVKEFRSRGNKNLLTSLWRPEWQVARAVDDISFSIEKGEAVAFLGPNGAGKTTTTKMMAGLIYPSSGQVLVLDRNPFLRQPDLLRRIGLVMGNRSGLNWDLTARQSYELFGIIYEIAPHTLKQRIEELTTMLDVVDKLDAQVRRLSLGERMKLELIGAILHQPEVLFLDEPTIGLDITSKQVIREFLSGLHAEGRTTLILTSHDMDDIESVCDRVIIINDGAKVYDASMSELLEKYSSKRSVQVTFAQQPAEKNLASMAGYIGVVQDTASFEVEAEEVTALIGAITRKHQPIDIQIHARPLEAIIAEIYEV
jgi:ABC-2 type transport system ATP-binding protein